ncbi:hypothetical protein F511_44722 [Dorcoceras hygrometricum]|uniref:Uncharacterized protein n=1 Tax=Dorcoceras hygrometricum TaxID=472368 RepID=A0A2Z7BHZ6_9LAMI|nr:hypothetical protein F511_44722 [Dorcoceras hygrometricum]
MELRRSGGLPAAATMEKLGAAQRFAPRPAFACGQRAHMAASSCNERRTTSTSGAEPSATTRSSDAKRHPTSPLRATSARPPRNKVRNRRRNNCAGRWLSIGQRCAQRLARSIAPTAQSRATSALDFVSSGRPASGRREAIARDNARPRARSFTRSLKPPHMAAAGGFDFKNLCFPICNFKIRYNTGNSY